MEPLRKVRGGSAVVNMNGSLTGTIMNASGSGHIPLSPPPYRGGGGSKGMGGLGGGGGVSAHQRRRVERIVMLAIGALVALAILSRLISGGASHHGEEGSRGAKRQQHHEEQNIDEAGADVNALPPPTMPVLANPAKLAELQAKEDKRAHAAADAEAERAKALLPTFPNSDDGVDSGRRRNKRQQAPHLMNELDIVAANQEMMGVHSPAKKSSSGEEGDPNKDGGSGGGEAQHQTQRKKASAPLSDWELQNEKEKGQRHNERQAEDRAARLKALERDIQSRMAAAAAADGNAKGEKPTAAGEERNGEEPLQQRGDDHNRAVDDHRRVVGHHEHVVHIQEEGGAAGSDGHGKAADADLVVLSDDAFEASFDPSAALDRRYRAINAMMGSVRKPRRLVLFTTLKPCYDTSIRFAQLDAVRSWVSLPMARRDTAPFAHNGGGSDAFFTSVDRSANDTAASSASSFYSAPPPVTVYLLVGGSPAVEQQQLEDYEASQKAQKDARAAKAARKRAERGDGGDGGDYDGNDDRNRNKKERSEKPLFNDYAPFGESPAAMTEGQCSQWIADTINKDYQQHLHHQYASSSSGSGSGGGGSSSRRTNGGSHHRRSAASSAGAASIGRGPVVVVPRSEVQRGKSGTVLLGAAVYSVVDAAMAAEQSNVAAEAERVLVREATRALAFDWYRKNERGVGGRDGNGNGEGGSGDTRTPTFRLANTFKRALSAAASNHAAAMTFSERANRLMFGFINGDIILDPSAAIALQRSQDVFGEKVFVVGKRRSVTLKLKHRQSAVTAGIVVPHHDDDDDETNENKNKKRKHPIDFSVAGWESHPIFKQSVGDRADAEDYFIWSGDFWTTADDSLKAPMAMREGWGLSSSSSSSSSILPSSMSAINNMQFIPNFHIGRPVFDNWLLNKAIQTWQPVVDASNMLLAYHQLHNYDHLGKEKRKKKKSRDYGDDDDRDEQQATKAPSYWGREESEENRELALANGGWRYGTIDFVPIQFSANGGNANKEGQQRQQKDDVDGNADGNDDSVALPSCANKVYLGLATARKRFASSSTSSSSPLVFVNSIGEESSLLPSAIAANDDHHSDGGRGEVSWYSLYQHAASGHTMEASSSSSSLPATAASTVHTPYTGVLVGGYDPMLEVGAMEGGDEGLSAKAQQLLLAQSKGGSGGGNKNGDGRAGAALGSVPYLSTPYAIDALVKADGEASSSPSQRIFSNMYTATAVASPPAASSSSAPSTFYFPQCVLSMKSDWNAPEELVEAYGPQLADLAKVWAHYYEGYTRQYGRQSQFLLQDGAAVQREKRRHGKKSGASQSRKRGGSGKSLSTNSLLFLLGEGGLEPLTAAGRREAMRHQQTKADE